MIGEILAPPGATSCAERKDSVHLLAAQIRLPVQRMAVTRRFAGNRCLCGFSKRMGATIRTLPTLSFTPTLLRSCFVSQRQAPGQGASAGFSFDAILRAPCRGSNRPTVGKEPSLRRGALHRTDPVWDLHARNVESCKVSFSPTPCQSLDPVCEDVLTSFRGHSTIKLGLSRFSEPFGAGPYGRCCGLYPEGALVL